MDYVNIENRAAILLAAEEVSELGRLWIKIGDESVYIPELIKQLQQDGRQE